MSTQTANEAYLLNRDANETERKVKPVWGVIGRLNQHTEQEVIQ
jgi:hypothetical protein